MIVVTGASGQLGGLVIEELLKNVKPSSIVAAARSPKKAEDLAARGVAIREMDYSRPETLASALQGASRLLLISGNELGERVQQHRAVIDAAKTAGLSFVAYTSILHCDSSPLLLAKEHQATEEYLKASGLNYSLLRNGWYYENQTAAIPSALQNGAFVGASGNGRFSAASRSDYAAAAAVVLARQDNQNSVLELAGDDSYTRAELAAEVSRQTGKNISYNNLPEADYQQILRTFLPAALAEMIADAEAHTAHGALEDNSRALSDLIGRPTTTLAQAVADALQTPPSTH